MQYEVHLKNGMGLLSGNAMMQALTAATDVLVSADAVFVLHNEDGSRNVVPRENIAFITIGAEAEEPKRTRPVVVEPPPGFKRAC